jgi:hypothetical protein
MLSKQDRAMIRESARGMNGAAAANFESAIIARCQELLDNDVVQQITKNHVRAAITAELAASK